MNGDSRFERFLDRANALVLTGCITLVILGGTVRVLIWLATP